MEQPKIFISYSHDSPSHDARVLAVADRLRRDGIDAVLDQYEPFPTRGWIHWMKQQVRDTKFILVVCTEPYRNRWEGTEKPGIGLGATYEGQLIQQLLYDAGGVNERFVPVLLHEGDSRHIPIEIRRYSHFALYKESGYEELYRLLTNQPKVLMPAVGPPLPLKTPKADFRNVIWNVPSRNPFFTGRESQLASINEALSQASPSIWSADSAQRREDAVKN